MKNVDLTKGAFRYYVIMLLTFLGPPTQPNCHFLTPPTHFDDVILEWSQTLNDLWLLSYRAMCFGYFLIFKKSTK